MGFLPREGGGGGCDTYDEIVNEKNKNQYRRRRHHRVYSYRPSRPATGIFGTWFCNFPVKIVLNINNDGNIVCYLSFRYNNILQTTCIFRRLPTHSSSHRINTVLFYVRSNRKFRKSKTVASLRDHIVL